MKRTILATALISCALVAAPVAAHAGSDSLLMLVAGASLVAYRKRKEGVHRG